MTLTLNDIPLELSRALEAETRRLGQSLEEAALEVLRRGLGIQPSAAAASMRRFSGLWSPEEHAEFERAVESFEAIDEDLWR